MDQGFSAVKRNDALGDYSKQYGQQTNNRGTVAAIASKQQTQQQLVNKRGSEFKKSAQQMLNK